MKKNPFRHAAIVIIRMIGMIYFGMILYLAGCQRRMIYLPSRAPEEALTAVADRAGFAAWRGVDEEIIGWRSSTNDPPADSDAMIVFHGNAGHALHRLFFARGFAQPVDDPAFIVYLFEYPGYGARPGRPAKPAFITAASEALHQAIEAHSEGRIFLTGESLGSGVAAHLAGRFPDRVAGLFLATPFTSLADVAKHHYPIMPVHMLMRDRYEAAVALREYNGPIAVLLAEQDRVVPARFGQALYDRYEGPKRIWIQRDRDHNQLDYDPHSTWWMEVITFLKIEAQREPASITGTP